MKIRLILIGFWHCSAPNTIRFQNRMRLFIIFIGPFLICLIQFFTNSIIFQIRLQIRHYIRLRSDFRLCSTADFTSHTSTSPTRRVLLQSTLCALKRHRTVSWDKGRALSSLPLIVLFLNDPNSNQSSLLWSKPNEFYHTEAELSELFLHNLKTITLVYCLYWQRVHLIQCVASTPTSCVVKLMTYP